MTPVQADGQIPIRGGNEAALVQHRPVADDLTPEFVVGRHAVRGRNSTAGTWMTQSLLSFLPENYSNHTIAKC